MYVYSDKGIRYQKIKKLGQGSFGVVHLVHDPKGAAYVIKTVDRLSTPEARVEAKREVDILRLSESSCGHPNVIKYHDSFLRGNDLCILMEYAPNGNLSEYIAQCRVDRVRVTEIDVTHKLRQMLSALFYCHTVLKVIHRDIKPANVLIDRYGTLKLTDFGISKQMQDMNLLCATQAGTPLYMPPEMMSGLKYSFKADVWMLGCVLYELMALEMPWGVVRNMEVLAERIKTQVINLDPLRAHYSPELCRLVLWLLHRDATRRPSTIEVIALFSLRAPPSYETTAAVDAARCIQSSFRSSLKKKTAVRRPAVAMPVAEPAPAPAVAPPPKPLLAPMPARPPSPVELPPTAYGYDKIVDDILRADDRARWPAAPARPLYPAVSPPAAEARQDRACLAIQGALRRSLNRRREKPTKPSVPAKPSKPLGNYRLDAGVYDAPRMAAAYYRASRRIDELAAPKKPKTPVAYPRVPARRQNNPFGAPAYHSPIAGVPRYAWG